MLFLKLIHPFRGYGTLVLIISFLTAIVGCMIVLASSDYSMYSFLVGGLIFVGAVVIAYLIINRPRAEETEKIEAAKELSWRMLTEKEREQFETEKSIDKVTRIILIAVPFVMGAIAFFSSEEVGFAVGFFLVSVLIVGIIYIVLLVRQGIWTDADGSIECAELDVDHVKKIKHSHKGSVSYSYYAVYYTPEGRFMAQVPEKYLVHKAALVRYKGRYTYAFFETDSKPSAYRKYRK